MERPCLAFNCVTAVGCLSVFKWGSHQKKKGEGGGGWGGHVCVWMRPPAAHGCSASEISAHLNSHLNPFTKGPSPCA